MNDSKEHQNELQYEIESRASIAFLQKKLAENEAAHSELMRKLFQEQALLRDLGDCIRRYSQNAGAWVAPMEGAK